MISPKLLKAIKLCRTKKPTLQVLKSFAVRGNLLILTDLDHEILARVEAPNGLYLTDTFVRSGGNFNLSRVLTASGEAAREEEYPLAIHAGKRAELHIATFEDMGGLADFVSEGVNRTNLTGVCISPTAMIATNGHVLMTRTLPADTGAKAVIVRSDHWRIAEKLKRLSSLQKVEITETTIHFHYENFVYTGKLIAGPYPDYRRVIPEEHKLVQIITPDGREMLINAIKSLLKLQFREARVYKDFAYAQRTDRIIKVKTNLGYSYFPEWTSFNLDYLLLCLNQFPGTFNMGSSRPLGPLTIWNDATLALVMPIKILSMMTPAELTEYQEI